MYYAFGSCFSTLAFLMSVLCILQQQYKASGEQPDTMSRKEAAMFPFISSFTLVGLYVLYKVTKHLNHDA